MTESKQSGCETCVAGGGACCRRFTLIHLSDKEYDHLEANGAALRELDPTDEESTAGLFLLGGQATRNFFAQVPPGHRVYGFVMDCPFLVTRPGSWAQCAEFESEERPAACGQFRVNSDACHDAQTAWAGLQEILEGNRE